jgi:hypothetical protein
MIYTMYYEGALYKDKHAGLTHTGWTNGGRRLERWPNTEARQESDPAGGHLCCDGRSMPPSLTDRTACPGLELLRCELLANPAAVLMF